MKTNGQDIKLQRVFYFDFLKTFLLNNEQIRKFLSFIFKYTSHLMVK